MHLGLGDLRYNDALRRNQCLGMITQLQAVTGVRKANQGSAAGQSQRDFTSFVLTCTAYDGA